jgi:hypothetical protein
MINAQVSSQSNRRLLPLTGMAGPNEDETYIGGPPGDGPSSAESIIFGEGTPATRDEGHECGTFRLRLVQQ